MQTLESWITDRRQPGTADWSDGNSPKEDLPPWGHEIRLEGVRVNHVKHRDFSVHMRPPGHMIEFQCKSVTNALKVNSRDRLKAPLEKGQFLFVHQGIEARRESIDPDEEAEFIAICVDPAHWVAQYGDVLEGRSVSFAESLPSTLYPSLVRTGWLMQQCFTKPQQYSKQSFEASIGHVLSSIILRASNLAKKARPVSVLTDKRLIKRAKSFIDDNIDKAISLSDIAGVTGYSTQTITAIFKAETGYTPYDYVLSRRIKRARALLTRTNQEIRDIAAQTGFSSQSHFSNYFKRLTGITPARFRKENQ